MTNPAWIWLIANWISLPVLAVVGGILVKRKLHGEFPFFFIYVVVTVMAGAVRMAARFGAAQTYFYAYWVTDLVISVFSFLAVYELFVRRLFPGFYKIRIYRYLFAAALAGIIFFGWLAAIQAPNVAAAFAIEERVLDSVLVGALGFLVLLMMVMGRQWTIFDFGVAFGFAIDAAAFLVVSAAWVRSRYHPTSIEELPAIAYDVSTLIWLYCFSSGKKPRVNFPDAEGPELVQQARTWEKVLKDWLRPKKKLP